MTAGPRPWADHGACRGLDPDLFFPEKAGAEIRFAQAVCARCPVIAECREWGILHEIHGIWGGLTQNERRAIRRKLQIAVTRAVA